jgi:large subunit ribosomal protein L22
MIAAPDRELVKARARHVRTSARKARLVLEHIRGKRAGEARAILTFQPRAAARDAYKVLASAIANADTKGYDEDDLVVVAAYADEGPTIKRWRPRARGRVNRIKKRTCHITIELLVVEAPAGSRRSAAAAEAPAPSRRTSRAKAPAAEAAAETVEAPVEAEPEAPAEAEAAEQPEAAEPEAEASAEDAPKPKPRARRTAKPKPAEADEPAAEEAPKPKPKPRAKPRARKPAAEAEPKTDDTPDQEASE